MNYLADFFDFRMVSFFKYPLIQSVEVLPIEIPSDTINSIANPDTARELSRILGREISTSTKGYVLDDGDFLYVAQPHSSAADGFIFMKLFATNNNCAGCDSKDKWECASRCGGEPRTLADLHI